MQQESYQSTLDQLISEKTFRADSTNFYCNRPYKNFAITQVKNFEAV